MKDKTTRYVWQGPKGKFWGNAYERKTDLDVPYAKALARVGFPLPSYEQVMRHLRKTGWKIIKVELRKQTR